MPKLIIDRFTSLPISRQERYQLRRLEAGRCRQCGEPETVATICPRCRKNNTVRMRAERERLKDPVQDMI